ncbi:hypothetical protein BUALT_Bualt13G0023400 [Buddleja alternifolia]|uniref:CRIB domain-containing protein n=1 Tax=Buddleja alternifolia TaxID=168488 RepID=A0AAV6WRA4_9LAMI|nr:hypothetical protein BUALT_Bualt13G0023400 [Buddleja alternifolia]
MATKMKGLLKGLRYISQIFDEEKEQEMQIGLPTDVKHVAHIGWDGPKVDSPSWMKEFKAPTGYHTAPLGSPGDPLKEDPEIHWVSEDSKRGHRTGNSPRTGNPQPDLPEVPRSSRRHHHHTTENNTNDSPKKKDSTKQRSSRRHQHKDPSDTTLKFNHHQRDPTQASTSSPARNLPDIPKKSRRKKSKETDGGDGSTRSRSKESDGKAGSTRSRSKGMKATDTGQDSGPTLEKYNSQQCPILSVHDDEEKESRVDL